VSAISIDSQIINIGGNALRQKQKSNKATGVAVAGDIPDSAIESFARCLFPSIRAFFESEDGQYEFAEWQVRKDIEELLGKKIPDIIVQIARVAA